MSLLKVSPLIALLMLLVTSTQAETLRDPTRPGYGALVIASVASSHSSDLILNSVIKAGPVSRAVINNEIFEVGDRVQGVNITAIEINSVSLSDGRKLTMFQVITESKEN
ncbi:MSHA biogenesis protein MshK [Shewanella psychropiezotolerans]|uniref:MSHA biogenesis protein MshK n=1 Tax=Shewanella psychropiezotolerans TaxID=2593655 RepID=A0ABX5WYW0_9GAMM|nr:MULTISPECIES: MSHA biogenesis protein MshK [Shewanella]MPY25878.1 MSHA biogenesis protein MshK [Shewanella sp. YLB-07]QDO82206.1 MSHA biogenesis protein MshK [Shewanella psychropiezotolerans]